MTCASAHRIRRVGLLVVVVLLVGLASTASARPATKPVRYHGYALSVPRSWTVVDLSRHPETCVRFDRHAVYLGQPGSQQSCPAHTVGRTGAILVAPATAGVRRAMASSAGITAATGVPHLDGSASTFVARRAGVLVTATWARDSAVVAHALHRRSLSPTRLAHPGAPTVRPARRRSTPLARTAAASFSGLGFDPCSAPSSSAMTAWGSSPYEAIGVYIGGTNSACAQPNLTATWVAGEVVAGWHMIPIYVGRQAPSNSCGCAAISPSRAAAQGAAAAQDAVADAEGLGIPEGNPIYDDMEAYSTTSTNTTAVLAFLSAWTSELHALGYLSGVYSSTGSGIADLVKHRGTTFKEPDDVWFAEWNNSKSATSSTIPAADFVNHRLHQYRGGHNETYRGVTINIDNDFVDGDTADTSGTVASAAPPRTPPSLRVRPAADGTTALQVNWAGASGVASWRVLAGSTPTALTSVTSARARGASQRISLRSAAAAFAVQARDSAGNVLAMSPAVSTPAHIAVFGKSAFVPAKNGVGGVPVGCYVGTVCHLTTTVSAGSTVIARTGIERVAPNSAAILYFRLNAKGRGLLTHALGGRLAVQVKVLDSTGTGALVPMTLVPFITSGRAPAHSNTPAPPLRIVGNTHFVSSRGTGGILAGCSSTTTCKVSTVVSVGRTVVARTKRENIGAEELGYLIFNLTPKGRSLMAHSRSNQLGAKVTISSSGLAVAAASVGLVGFH
jgi:glycoside hydrolase-like protein